MKVLAGDSGRVPIELTILVTTELTYDHEGYPE